MKKLFFICTMLFAVSAVSCDNKGGEVDPDAPRPVFEDVESDDYTSNGAWLYASYDYSGKGEITEAGFAYKDDASTKYIDVKDAQWDQTGVICQLNGLQPATDYRFYCYVVVGGQRYNSNARGFSTAEQGGQPSEPKPAFLAPAASDLTESSAVLSCVYTYNGDKTVSAASFSYKATADATYKQIASTGKTSPLGCTLTGLTAGTSYTFHATLVIDGKTYESPDAQFSTRTAQGEVVPSFGTPYCFGLTSASASVSCNFAYTGTATISEVGFQYKSSSASTYTKKTLSTAVENKSAELTGLSASTLYNVALYAIIGGKTYSSPEISFTTSAASGGNTGAKYSGWAELPVQKTVSGDYYYAYHLCPDVYVPGTSNSQKRRNFGVCYSDDLKCAIWVAAPMHDCYAVKNATRTDIYKADPTIPVSQPGKWSGYTRGHMLGSSERLVSRATNLQVFYHSNIAPQLGQPYFNTGGGAWNTLEDWVDTQWVGQSDTTYQIIGTYWKNKNKVVSGTTIPTHYYKVLLRTKNHKNKWVVSCSRDELQCIAIMIEHRTYSQSEVPKPNQYQSKGLIYSVKQIEEMTGITFFPNVPNAPKDTYNLSDWGL